MALPEGIERPADGLLKREYFTSDVVRSFVLQMAKQGGEPVMSDEDREASLSAMLTDVPAGRDVWVFGYGSLMWNPAIHVVESRKARITGYHRRFCLTLRFGRGSAENPGLMLALDEGGDCVGVAHRIAAADVRTELGILWQREMISGAYHPKWLDAEIDGTHENRVLSFIINREHPRCEGQLDGEDMARRIATATGIIGTNRDYLYRMVQHLNSLGMDDGPMHELERRVRVFANEPEKETQP